ncbi:MAG: site-specific integrase [Alphaproteobacteria bacterium]|nr:site-specific integrase [Alphaproteobacteria bacterium]
MNNRIMLTDKVAKQARPTDKEYLIHDLALKGFGLRVRSTGAKSWILRLSIDGKVQRRTLGNPKTLSAEDARAKAHALLAERQTEASAAEIIRPTAPTFEAFTRIYLDRKVSLQKPSGRRSVEVYLRCTLLPAFQDMPLDRIRRADVAKWFHDYGERRPGGANRALAILSNMFNCARDWGLLTEDVVNPCRGIRTNRSVPVGRILSSDELRRLGVALERQALVRPDQVDAVRLLLLTGCRHGEILGLRWKEVGPGRLDLSDSKTGPRRVLLGEPAVALLERRRKRQQGRSAFVFPSPADPSRSRASLKSFWLMIRRQADLPPTLRLHDLRHSYASYAVMRGETLIMTGKLLGHRHAGTTQRYAHLSGDFLLAAAERVAAAILERGRWVTTSFDDAASVPLPHLSGETVA